MSAEEFLMKNPNQYLGMTPVEFAEAYHKQEVEAITDEEIDLEALISFGYFVRKNPDNVMRQNYLEWKKTYKPFKNKLLKQ